MKKALVLLLALSMVFGVFAAEPVANVNVAEFSGEASVQWGVDLDAKETGFKNDAKVTLKLNLIDGGDKSSTGEGIWGEIKIKTDGDTFMKSEGQDAAIGTLPTKVKVDTAKLHFGDNAYIGIMSGDTKVGEYKLDTAVAAEQIKNENKGAFVVTKIDDDTLSGPTYQNGIVAGYGNDLFAIDVDFRSAKSQKEEVVKAKTEYKIVNACEEITEGDDAGKYKVTFADGTTKVMTSVQTPGNVIAVTTEASSSKVDDSQYSNAYSFAADLSVKAVENLTLKGGYSKDLANKYDEIVTDAFYVAADYKLGLNDTFYLKPQVGYTQEMSSEDDTKWNTGNLVAALLFGWGDKADDKPGVYFLDSDNGDEGKNSKKVTPGISVAMSMPLVDKFEMEVAGTTVETTTKAPSRLAVSFFSGEIVENLTAAAYFATDIGESQTITKAGGAENKGPATEAEGYEFAAGLKYKLTAGEGSITPQFGIAMANKGFNSGVINYTDKDATDADNKDKEVLNIKVGAEFGGYVENTTFSVVYASNNLKDKDNAGTLNFTCKIAL